MNDLKVYYADFGWSGGVLVLAKTKEEAIELMKDTEIGVYNSDKDINTYIKEAEIKEGAIVEFEGDR